MTWTSDLRDNPYDLRVDNPYDLRVDKPSYDLRGDKPSYDLRVDKPYDLRDDKPFDLRGAKPYALPTGLSNPHLVVILATFYFFFLAPVRSHITLHTVKNWEPHPNFQLIKEG